MHRSNWTAALIYAVRDGRHEFEFIEGSIVCAAAKGIVRSHSSVLSQISVDYGDTVPVRAGVSEAFPEETEFFKYFDENKLETVRSALDQIHSHLAQEHPPYDGILGFSQGALLAAAVLVEQSRDLAGTISPPIRCGVLICATLPSRALAELKVTPESENVVRVPTFHVCGRHDEYYEESIKLSRFCEPAKRQIYDHGGSHEIPRSTRVTEAMANGLQSCVLAAYSKQ